MVIMGPVYLTGISAPLWYASTNNAGLRSGMSAVSRGNDRDINFVGDKWIRRERTWRVRVIFPKSEISPTSHSGYIPIKSGGVAGCGHTGGGVDTQVKLLLQL